MSNVLRVLIIDDSVLDAELILYEISKNCITEHALVDNAKDMRRAISEKLWDIVLCDYSMPEFDPYKALDILREFKLEIPLIVISGKIGEDSAIKLLKAGCHDCIMKSDLSRLSEVINREIKEANVREENVILNKKLQKYKILTEQANDAMLFLDLDGNILDVNDRAIKEYGYSFEEFLTMTIFDLRYEPDKQFIKIQMDIANKNGIIFETIHKRKDNTIFYAEVSSQGMKLEEKNVLISIIRDITERKKSEVLLRDNEERYRTLSQTSMDGFYVAEIDGRIREVNDAYCLMSGYSREKLLSMHISELEVTETKEEVKEHSEKIMEKGSDKFETRHRKADGTLFDVQNRVTYFANKTLFLCFISDITKRKKAEEELNFERNMAKKYLDTADVILLVLDRDEKVSLINIEGCKVLEFKQEDILGKNWFDNFISKSIVKEAKQVFNKLITDGIKDTEYNENLVTTAKGEERLINWHSAILYDNAGNITGILCSGTDITERKMAEDLIRESEEKYRLLYTSMNQGLALHEIITDADGKPVDYVFLDINDSYTRLLGVTREMCIGKRITEVMPKVEKYWIDIFGKVALSGEPSYYENYLETTGRYYSTYTYSPKKRQFAVLVSDITEQKKNQEKLMHMSYHDHLTGLYNRRFFEEELNRLDTKRNLPLTIIMGDINGLKIINDSFGHAVGDDYLKKTSEIIKKVCRADDIAARLGGDEFVVILPNANTSEAIKIIDHIKDMISETNIGAIELSVSFGLATKESEKQSVLETVISAENYMYSHKTYERASMRSNTIDLIMNTLFEKSGRESRHSNRVSAICEAIASNMNFIKDDVNQIRIAGMVHDIGKIGIKEEILNKSGSLDNDEWAEIKRHPEAGWRILSATIEFSEVSEFVLRHHERWNGSGYPNGLKGEEIPIEARIIAVADAYDAMTSERTYKNAYSKDEAINELKRCSGTQFDPEIVEAFVNKVIPYNSNFGEGG